MDSLVTVISEGEVFRYDLVEYAALSIMSFRVLDRFNAQEFAEARPGVYALAYGDWHDAQRVQPPFTFGQAGDLRAELSAQLGTADPMLAERIKRGDCWFRAVYAPLDSLDEALADLKAQYGSKA